MVGVCFRVYKKSRWDSVIILIFSSLFACAPCVTKTMLAKSLSRLKGWLAFIKYKVCWRNYIIRLPTYYVVQSVLKKESGLFLPS